MHLKTNPTTRRTLHLAALTNGVSTAEGVPVSEGHIFPYFWPNVFDDGLDETHTGAADEMRASSGEW